jgi:hypothetical protein
MATQKATGNQPDLTATLKKKPATKVQGKKTKDGLRKPQIRVLGALAKSKQPLTRPEISEKGDVDLACLNSYIGAHDKKIRAKNDKNYKSLLTLGFVKDSEREGKTVYAITAAGRKALAAAK